MEWIKKSKVMIQATTANKYKHDEPVGGGGGGGGGGEISFLLKRECGYKIL